MKTITSLQNIGSDIMRNLVKASLIIISILVISVPAVAQEVDISKIELPDNFQISIYAENVPGARSMSMSPNGILYVGTRKEGKVYAITDKNDDNKADKVHTIASGKRSPNGVAWRNGNLYVAEISRILKFTEIDNNLDSPPDPEVIYDEFPTKGYHGWKFIKFGPDGKLYVPVGAPCNVCKRENPVFSSITRLDTNGQNREIYARGIRNTVGFDWHPESEVLWFTDNGRDHMGDNKPPDELNKAPKKGMHFGFPFCHGKNIQDLKFTKRKCTEFTPPVLELGPHVAALGMRFYTGKMFPEKYKGGIFIAEHGSWNRTVPIGYRIMYVKVEDNKPVSLEVFAEGWLQDEEDWGRPVDVLVRSDGSLLVSDDKSGTIYRISYSK